MQIPHTRLLQVIDTLPAYLDAERFFQYNNNTEWYNGLKGAAIAYGRYLVKERMDRKQAPFDKPGCKKDDDDYKKYVMEEKSRLAREGPPGQNTRAHVGWKGGPDEPEPTIDHCNWWLYRCWVLLCQDVEKKQKVNLL